LFARLCRYDPYNARCQILRDLAFLATAEFGLKPATPLEERDYVYELYKIYRDRSKRGDGEGTRHGAEVGLGLGVIRMVVVVYEGEDR
jgi:hypothetical protein